MTSPHEDQNGLIEPGTPMVRMRAVVSRGGSVEARSFLAWTLVAGAQSAWIFRYIDTRAYWALVVAAVILGLSTIETKRR